MNEDRMKSNKDGGSDSDDFMWYVCSITGGTGKYCASPYMEKQDGQSSQTPLQTNKQPE